MTRQFSLDRGRGKLLGVAAGLAHYTGVDVVWVRLGLVVATLLTGPVMLLLYGLTGWLAGRR